MCSRVMAKFRQKHKPCGVPAFSYLDFNFAAVAFASDLTLSVAVGTCADV